MSVNHKIGIGTAQFGMDYGISNSSGKVEKNEVKKIIDGLPSLGIDTIDTASVYGNAETILGNNNLDNINVITKFTSKDVESMLMEFELSLKNLKQQRLYGYLCHHPNNIFENPCLWEKLIYLRNKGAIEKIGLSLSNISEVKKLLKSGMVPDILQIPYNIFDDRFQEISIILKSKGTEIHSRSAFLQGLFFLDEEKLKNKFNSVSNYVIKMRNDLGDKINAFLINFCCNQDFIDKIIIGVENFNQLEQNLQYLGDGIKFSYDGIPKRIEEEVINPTQW